MTYILSWLTMPYTGHSHLVTDNSSNPEPPPREAITPILLEKPVPGKSFSNKTLTPMNIPNLAAAVSQASQLLGTHMS